MSRQSDTKTDSTCDKSERAVTDSVHERFRQEWVRCDICCIDILGNHDSIEKHFNRTHPSERFCCYCKGKVFTYSRIAEDKSSAQDIVYHKCHTPNEV